MNQLTNENKILIGFFLGIVFFGVFICLLSILTGNPTGYPCQISQARIEQAKCQHIGGVFSWEPQGILDHSQLLCICKPNRRVREVIENAMSRGWEYSPLKAGVNNTNHSGAR